MKKIINFTPTGTQPNRENSLAPLEPNQIIEELLDGIVSFLVMKVNGQVAIIMGSLKEGIVNGEENVRQAAFSPLGDGRILLWSTVKQKWSSFYPDNLLSMTRDDTDDLE